jgi:hypothetical protein
MFFEFPQVVFRTPGSGMNVIARFGQHFDPLRDRYQLS